MSLAKDAEPEALLVTARTAGYGPGIVSASLNLAVFSPRRRFAGAACLPGEAVDRK